MSGIVLRTPEAQFANVPDFPYTPHYVDDLPGYVGLRMAYIDEGPAGAPVFLCLHGEPSWSFLYRKMIPPFLAAGARVIAPDLFGFGRSDKPAFKDDYSYDFHRGALLALVERLDLRQVTLVVQDWGGILGLTLPLAAPARYQRLLIMNTALPVEPETSLLAADVFSGAAPRTGFAKWRALAVSADDLPIGEIVNRGSGNALTPAELAAYDAPYPDVRYKAGALHFPALVPLRPEMPGYAMGRAAIGFLNRWTGPAFMAVGPEDRVIPPAAMARLAQEIRGCSEIFTVPGGNHFLQERGDEVAHAALAYFGNHPVAD